jgi:hypothetical protein
MNSLPRSRTFGEIGLLGWRRLPPRLRHSGRPWPLWLSLLWNEAPFLGRSPARAPTPAAWRYCWRFALRAAPALKAKQQLRQLRHIDGNPPRLVFGEQLGGRSSPRLVLEINVRERLAVVVADDKARGCYCGEIQNDGGLSFLCAGVGEGAIGASGACSVWVCFGALTCTALSSLTLQ